MKRARKEPSRESTGLRRSTDIGHGKEPFKSADGTKHWSSTSINDAGGSGIKRSSGFSRPTNSSMEGTKYRSGSSFADKSSSGLKSTMAGFSRPTNSSLGGAEHRSGSVGADGKPSSESKAKPTGTPASVKKTGTKTSGATTAAGRKKSTKRKGPHKKSGKKRHILRKIFISFAILFFIGSIVLIGMGAGMYKAIYQELEDMNIRSLALNYSSFVYYADSEGNPVEEVQLHFEGERRIWVDSTDISINFKNAAVAIEDERFYEHNGVDLKRTAGATIGWILEKIGIGSADYGGSTLTQQLVKNITNEKDKSADRKIKEMMRAIALEKQIGDKDAILTMYLNISYFGNQCYGVEAASNLYFAKPAKDATIAEAATIVGITQSPSYYDPVKNPDNALEKRNRVLGKMRELDYITEEEYNEAVNSPLGLSEKVYEPKKVVYSYFVDAVIDEVTNDLVEQKGLSREAAEHMVFNGGLKIYTTMDKDIQDDMENVYENRIGFPTNQKAQSAMVVIDPKTGEVKGMVGGVGVKTDSRGLNRATQTTRQPGSSIKPLSVYGPALELGVVNSATVIRDEPITIKIGNQTWSPKNSYSKYQGDIVLSKCVEISSNTTAAKVLQDLGLESSYDFAKNKFHLNGIGTSDKNYAPLALGGLTNGVTVMDMAAAYATFANGGVYNKPHTYTKVLDSDGNVLLENTPSQERVVSEETAFIMTDILADVITGKSGTAKEAKLSNNMTAYGKTGTTNDNYDKWFVGYTTRYVGAVWFGCDTNTDLKTLGIKNNPSCAVWKQVMDRIHEGLAADEFDPPESVKKATLCSKTGKLASSGCPYAQTGYFAAGNIPTTFCKRACSKTEQEPDTDESPITIEPSDDRAPDIDITPPDLTPSTDKDNKPTKPAEDDNDSKKHETDTNSKKEESPSSDKPKPNSSDKTDDTIVIN